VRAGAAAREVDVAPRRPELSGPDKRLMLAALAGPLAWSVQLVAALPLVPWMCHRGLRWPLHALSLATLLVVLLALAHCWSRLGGEREKTRPLGAAEEQVDAPALVRRAIAWSGVALGCFFVLLVLATDFPGLILEPCR